jgi:TatD DNase family protein
MRISLLADAPWCEIRPTHASSKFVKTDYAVVKKKERWEAGCMVKSRNEPSMIMYVFSHGRLFAFSIAGGK